MEILGIGVIIMILLLWNIMRYLQSIEKISIEQMETNKKIIEFLEQRK